LHCKLSYGRLATTLLRKKQQEGKKKNGEERTVWYFGIPGGMDFPENFFVTNMSMSE
jgi:hypothetical protein